MKIVAFENDLDDVRLETFIEKELDGAKISIIDKSKSKTNFISMLLEYDDLTDLIKALNEFKVRLDEDLEEEDEDEDEDNVELSNSKDEEER